MDEELKSYLEGMEERISSGLRDYIDERTHDAETRIVRAFGAYQQSSGVRLRKIETDLSNVNASTTAQVDNFQEKLLELETRIIALEGRKPAA